MSLGDRFIFILGMARSGTHFLGSILAQENWISYLDETFNEALARSIPFNFTEFLSDYIRTKPDWILDRAWASRAISQYWEHISDSTPREKKILIDVKEEHLRILDWPPILLDDVPNLLQSILSLNCPIIHCSRLSLLSAYASIELAQSTGVWIIRSNQSRSPSSQIRIRPDDLFRYIESRRLSQGLMTCWLANHGKVVHLNYETLVDGSELSLAARTTIGKLIGRPLSPNISAKTVKQAPPLHDLIENLTEVIIALQNRGHADILEEIAPGRSMDTQTKD